MLQSRLAFFRHPFTPFTATLRAPLVRVAFALFEMGGELLQAEGIEHAVFRDCALAGHQYAPPDIVDLVRRMGVGIDAEQTPQLKTAFAPAPGATAS